MSIFVIAAAAFVSGVNPNSSLWFLDPKDFDAFGPVIGRGAVWQDEDVKAGTVSDPYLFAGYDMSAIRAYWVRAVADRDCTATVQFEYR